MNKKLLTLAISLPVSGVFASALSVQTAYAYPSCDAQVDLQGQINGTSAEVTNYSKNPDCSYDATLAIYDSPKEPNTANWIDEQILIGSKSVKVKPGETVALKVDAKASYCWNQADLIRGGQAWEKPYYRNAMDAEVYRTGNCGGTTVTPTPSCTVTPTVTNTPTVTPTGTTTTATPTAEAKGASTTGFAKTGNKAVIYMLVLGALASLTGGLVLKRFSK